MDGGVSPPSFISVWFCGRWGHTPGDDVGFCVYFVCRIRLVLFPYEKMIGARVKMPTAHVSARPINALTKRPD